MDPFPAHIRLLLMMVTAFLAFVAVVVGALALYYVVDATQQIKTATDQIRQSQLDGTPLGRKIEKSTGDTSTTVTLLQDCLDPSGKCYQRSQANQVKVLGLVRSDMFVIAACLDEPGQQTQAEIKACYDKAETRGQKKTP